MAWLFLGIYVKFQGCKLALFFLFLPMITGTDVNEPTVQLKCIHQKVFPSHAPGSRWKGILPIWPKPKISSPQEEGCGFNRAPYNQDIVNTEEKSPKAH